MAIELDERVLQPTRWFFALPSARRLVAYIFFFAFLAGFILHLRAFPLADAFLFGSTAGIFLFAVPALFAALLSTTLLSRKAFRVRLKYFLFTAFIAEILTAISYFIAAYFLFGGYAKSEQIVLLGNALVFVAWFTALSIGLDNGKYRSGAIAFFHPLLNLAFIVLWRGYGLLEPAVATSGWVAVPKLIVASIVMLLALSSIFYLLNAPARRNFGVSSLQALTLFMAQWAGGSQELEVILDELGEEVETTVGAVVFRARNGAHRIKAVFLSPNVHFGPFGNLGGSEFSALISKRVGEKLHAPAFVFHGTAYHDFNPVHATQVGEITDALINAVDSCKQASPQATLLTRNVGSAHADGFAADGGVFLTLSRAPKATDDIDYSSGRALANLLRAPYGAAVLVDRHNSKTEGKRHWEVGSPEYTEFEEALFDLRKTAHGPVELGIAHSPLSDCTPSQGIGSGGLRVAVLKVGGKRWCIAVFDANNITPVFRSQLLSAIRGKGFVFADVCTTDTHVVNTISGVHNPLGPRVDAGKLLTEFVKTVEAADADLSPVSVGIASKPLHLRVLGTGRASEVIYTVNAILAIAKIIAPVIFVLSLLLAFLALLAL